MSVQTGHNGADPNAASIGATGNVGAVTSGNTVRGCVTWGTAVLTDLASVTDDKGNNYTIVDKVADVGNGQSFGTFYLTNITNGPSTVTANFNNTPNDRGIDWQEELASAAAVFDAHTMRLVTGPGTGTDQISSGNVTPSANNALVTGCVIDSSIGNLATLLTGTGFTADQGDTSATVNIQPEHLTQSVAASIAATFTDGTHGGADSYIVGAVVFKPAGGAAPNDGLNPSRVHPGATGPGGVAWLGRDKKPAIPDNQPAPIMPEATAKSPLTVHPGPTGPGGALWLQRNKQTAPPVAPTPIMPEATAQAPERRAIKPVGPGLLWLEREKRVAIPDAQPAPIMPEATGQVPETRRIKPVGPGLPWLTRDKKPAIPDNQPAPIMPEAVAQPPEFRRIRPGGGPFQVAWMQYQSTVERSTDTVSAGTFAIGVGAALSASRIFGGVKSLFTLSGSALGVGRPVATGVSLFSQSGTSRGAAFVRAFGAPLFLQTGVSFGSSRVQGLGASQFRLAGVAYGSSRAGASWTSLFTLSGDGRGRAQAVGGPLSLALMQGSSLGSSRVYARLPSAPFDRTIKYDITTGMLVKPLAPKIVMLI